AAHLETLRSGPMPDPHGVVGAVPAARAAGRTRAATGGAGPRPPPSCLPRRRSYRRLPTYAAGLLRVTRFRRLPWTDTGYVRRLHHSGREDRHLPGQPRVPTERDRIVSAPRRRRPNPIRQKSPTTQPVVARRARFCSNQPPPPRSANKENPDEAAFVLSEDARPVRRRHPRATNR